MAVEIVEGKIMRASMHIGVADTRSKEETACTCKVCRAYFAVCYGKHVTDKIVAQAVRLV